MPRELTRRLVATLVLRPAVALAAAAVAVFVVAFVLTAAATRRCHLIGPRRHGSERRRP
jgi:hypothetical protein